MTEVAIKQHYVTFYSPGTLFAEQTRQPVDSWDVDNAVAAAALITERHGAKPYGFRFTTNGRGPDDLNSKEIARSPMYYIGGKVETLDELVARNDPKDRILIENLKDRGYTRCWTATKGWSWTQPLGDDDVVITE